MLGISRSALLVSKETVSKHTQALQCSVAAGNTTQLRQRLMGFGKVSSRHTFKMLSLLRAASDSEIINKLKIGIYLET